MVGYQYQGLHDGGQYVEHEYGTVTAGPGGSTLVSSVAPDAYTSYAQAGTNNFFVASFASRNGLFTLTPNTAARIHSHVELISAPDPGHLAVGYGYLSVYVSSDGGYGNIYYEKFTSAGTPSIIEDWDGEVRTGSVEGVGQVSLGVVAHLPLVPEPAGYAMLLAGLGLVGAVSRRRR